jgi:Domain of unknown function (DUF6933)
MRQPVDAPVSEPSTRLGNWFAKPLFWQPQYALFVSETTYLPVLAPLAPAVRLSVRFPDDLAATLQAHGVTETFIDHEIAAMDDVIVSKTDSRQVVGVLNEFAIMASRIRAIHPAWDPLQIAVELAGVPVGIRQSAYIFPDIELHGVVERASNETPNDG